jgi:hypothetical protein
VFLDVLEDFWSAKAKKGGNLFVMLYDQRKAYDSVQWYALRDALRRCALPEDFIEYVQNSLRGARARVRTAGGLTAPFDILTGVRQGDPLSALLYLFFIDPLLCGLCESMADGYAFSNDRLTTVPVLGYADDTITFSEDAESAVVQHAWAREWFGANCARINAKKCDLLVAGANPQDAPRLFTVNGTTVIAPKGPDAVVRYLGVFTSLRLNWGTQIRRLERAVRGFANRVVLNHLDFVASGASVSGFLMPKLEAGLRVIPLTAANRRMTDRWSGIIMRARLKAAGVPLPVNGRLCHEAVRLMTGTMSISDMH